MVVTESLVDRIVAIEIANLESRLTAHASGPCAGVFLQRFGRATAFVSTHTPVRFFNSVLGVDAGTVEHLDAIEAFYRGHGVPCALEVVPGRLTERLGLELARRGYAMVEFHVAMARALDRNLALPGGEADVEEISGDTHRFETFLDVYLEGWGTARGDLADAKSGARGWIGNESWRFYIAYLEGRPAGAAILDVRGPTALLASASTLPAARRYRLQSALIARRVADARAEGCDLVVGGAYFGTTSMRNQQRAGLATVFTRGIWVQAGAGWPRGEPDGSAARP